MAKKVCIIGSEGFIGKHLAGRSFAAGHGTLLYRRSDQDLDHVGGLFKDMEVQAVIWAAGPARQVDRMTGDELARAMGALPLFLDAATSQGAKPHLILLSSHAVYGYQAIQPISELAPLRPRHLYGALQVSRENVAMAYFHSRGLPVTILRLGTVYGPGMRKDALVQVFLDAAREGKEIQLEGGGAQVRPFVHVDDLCGLVNWILRKPSEVFAGSVVNVATNHVAVRVVAALVSAAVKAAGGPGAVLVEAPARAHEEGDVYLKTEQLTRVCGFTPTIHLDDGILRLVAEIEA